ncbi:unnamed protein product [Kuraishia capsulata CBS 1993]|uniref:Nucleolar protein 12 n=1 Tax=Kuraishia capsulata CBS 1993 TaxID=1382522 RepID=W6MFM9_9ASCO|nr:uncharacterized protein KUCA_T00000625001 [Kuraishia capsulata CBS 1993]CDK24659.1 unnamed protein product [Kuraishia capsulata CBS 1993]
MSGISSIFGAVSAKVDSKVAALFAKSAKSVDSSELINKKATGLPVEHVQPEAANDSKDNSDSAYESAEGSDVEMDEAPAPVPASVRPKKRRDEDDDLEDRYMAKLLEETKEEKKASSDNEEEKEVTQSAPKAQTVDLKLSELEKAERTVFVGNVSTQVITSSKLQKEFKNHFKKFGAISSVRFRSFALGELLPRKAAFITKAIDDKRDTVNAYVVFVQKADSVKATELNATVFHDHHLRVDHLTHPLQQDNKRSVFIGNLDFEEQEESLWKYFTKNCGDVENVRIIRDSKTNFGKGFAIVQFKDFLGVDKALLLHDKVLDTSEKKRKLRITRMKKTEKRSDRPLGKNARNLTEKEKSILGRGKKTLGKSDRRTLGKTLTIEGERAKKGVKVKGIKNGLGKVKKPRITKRSQKFRSDNPN